MPAPIASDVATVTCATCRACCCRLEVLLMAEDDRVPAALTEQDQWGGWVMRRLEDGWCIALDRATMRCRIYDRRPLNCRDYEMGGTDCLIERAAHGIEPTSP